MKISNRLISLAKLVENDDIIADIGCDHALLDIYLIENNIVSHTLACDINEKALNGGIQNIKKHHLENKIEVKLADGIDLINDDINTLIISGMGTKLICKILSNSKITQINKIIVQSNNDYYELRKFITSIGYIIDFEEVVFDKGKYYINIVFKKGNTKYTNIELKYGPLLMKNNTEYYRYLYNNNIDILNKIPKRKLNTRFKIIKDNYFLKKFIKK